MSSFENNTNVLNSYVHDSLQQFAKEYKSGRMSLPDYIQASTNLLDKTYNKNSVNKQIRTGRVVNHE